MRGFTSFVTLAATVAASGWYSYRFELQRLAPVEALTTDAVETIPQTATISTSSAQPYQEHTVVAGETLYSISKQYSLLWSTVAVYNQLSEGSVIKPGMTIKIPLNEKGEVVRIDRIEKPATLGTESWYSDPVVVVRKTSPNEYHLKNDDTYTIIGLDYATGTAMIEVVHDEKAITVTLAQNTPGKGNGWYITTLETR